MRCLVFDAARPGIANSLSYDGLGRGELYRWSRVDFLKDGVFLSGNCFWLTGVEKLNMSVCGSCGRLGSSPEVRDAGPWSKMSKSGPPKVDAPCMLLLFATGLHGLAASRFMRPSLRFRGLDLAGALGVVRSSRDRENASLSLMGLSSRPNRMECRCSVIGWSLYSEVCGAATFSSPELRLAVAGVALPWSVESASTRRGLLDLARVRGEERKPGRRRTVRFLGAATCGGEKAASVWLATGLVSLGLKARARARGEMGDRDESDRRRWKRVGLEGERDRVRRSSCIDEGISIP